MDNDDENIVRQMRRSVLETYVYVVTLHTFHIHSRFLSPLKLQSSLNESIINPRQAISRVGSLSISFAYADKSLRSN